MMILEATFYQNSYVFDILFMFRNIFFQLSFFKKNLFQILYLELQFFWPMMIPEASFFKIIVLVIVATF